MSRRHGHTERLPVPQTRPCLPCVGEHQLSLWAAQAQPPRTPPRHLSRTHALPAALLVRPPSPQVTAAALKLGSLSPYLPVPLPGSVTAQQHRDGSERVRSHHPSARVPQSPSHTELEPKSLRWPRPGSPPHAHPYLVPVQRQHPDSTPATPVSAWALQLLASFCPRDFAPAVPSTCTPSPPRPPKPPLSLRLLTSFESLPVIPGAWAFPTLPYKRATWATASQLPRPNPGANANPLLTFTTPSPLPARVQAPRLAHHPGPGPMGCPAQVR